MPEKDALDERIWKFRKSHATPETGSMERKLLDLNKKRHFAIRMKAKAKRAVTQKRWHYRAVAAATEIKAIMKNF